MDCVTLDKHDELGNPIYRAKRKFNTLDEAIAVAKVENAKNEHLEKVVAYKCKVCFKYHVGRNGKPLTDKERDKRKKELEKPIRFKILGKIKLT